MECTRQAIVTSHQLFDTIVEYSWHFSGVREKRGSAAQYGLLAHVDGRKLCLVRCVFNTEEQDFKVKNKGKLRTDATRHKPLGEHTTYHQQEPLRAAARGIIHTETKAVAPPSLPQK